ncbi:short-chain dehydrogenase reductase family protein [Rutstroemia sp. NJR-2017a WRK4]|nr:short-chain dehydrogenase reductase family protein [Rutstroemia sp. NJR-2017a WRK4]
MPSFLSIVWNNKFNLPHLPPPDSFTGKTILITGASGGLGLAAAVHFVNLGAKSVIITARTAAKGEQAKASIEAQTREKSKDVVKVMELDMSTFAGTKTFADRVTREVKEIDVVCLNVGAISTEFQTGEEGWEKMVEISLATTLLALLLLPWMKEAGKGNAHLGIVTSGLHRRVDIKKWPKENVIKYWSKKENWKNGQANYATSKLLEQYAVNEIAKLACDADGSPRVIVNSICPGMVHTDLGRGYGTNYAMSIAVNLFGYLACKTTEGGARTYVRAALTPPSEHGRHYTDYQTEEDYKHDARNSVVGKEGQEMQAQVWKETLDILGEHYPEVISNITA